jgi:hypothetical protein
MSNPKKAVAQAVNESTKQQDVPTPVVPAPLRPTAEEAQALALKLRDCYILLTLDIGGKKKVGYLPALDVYGDFGLSHLEIMALVMNGATKVYGSQQDVWLDPKPFKLSGHLVQREATKEKVFNPETVVLPDGSIAPKVELDPKWFVVKDEEDAPARGRSRSRTRRPLF